MLDGAIARARDYLRSQQVPVLETSREPTFASPIEVRSPWLSAILLEIVADDYGISGDEELVRSNIDYLRGTMMPGGEWKFINHPSYTVPADSDDTACALLALSRYSADLDFDEATENLERYRSDEGLFYTWLSDMPDNEIDVVVNGNVLRWLQRRGVYRREVAEFLVGYLKGDRDYTRFMRFYDSFVVARYFLTRALVLAPGFPSGELSQLVLAPLLRHNTKAISESPLNLALTCSVVSMLEPGAQGLSKLIERLVGEQQPAGSWRRCPVVVVPDFVPGGPYFCGCEALTTAFCLEALMRHRRGRSPAP